jgi:hypothetical protein
MRETLQQTRSMQMRESVEFSIPTHKSNIYAAALTTGSDGSDDRKAAAFQYISGYLELVFKQALAGDKLTGYFLATLITSLNKRKSRLEQANKAFKACWAKLESARYVTKRSSGVREIIEQIMFEADCKRWTWEFAKRQPGTSSQIGLNSAIKLPLPDHRSETAINKWSAYVHSELRKNYPDLVKELQPSRLRDRVRSEVKRIFKVWAVEQSVLETLKSLQ